MKRSNPTLQGMRFEHIVTKGEYEVFAKYYRDDGKFVSYEIFKKGRFWKDVQTKVRVLQLTDITIN